MCIFTFAFAILFAFKNPKGGLCHLFEFTFPQNHIALL